MKNTENVAIFVLISIFVFWLVSQKIMYKITGFITNLFGWESSSDGEPEQSGIVLHGVVLAILLTVAGHFFLME